ncbi:MAG: CUB domain-containing protein [Bacteroidales bacterium]
MIKKSVKIACIITAVIFTSLSFGQQIKQQSVPNFVNPFQSKASQRLTSVISPNTSINIPNSQKKSKFEIVNGSFSADFEKEGLNKEAITIKFNSWFNLNEQHSFKQLTERTDELGITHTNYQQYYKGYLVEGNLIMLHSKNGIVHNINGQIADFANIETQINISPEKALETAKSYLKVTNLINEYPVETVIIRIKNNEGFITKLSQKVRIDSYSPFIMCNVYIDAKNGAILNKINLITDADVPGTAQTLYSGSQSITCDSYSGNYRLRENGRKIETYNATNATNLTTSGFTGSSDFTSTSTLFAGVPRLSSFTISTIAQSWWYTTFSDEIPDLYIKIKDASAQTVYTSGYYNNTNPPVTFNNLNIVMTNPPYTVEIWDYDVVGGDDYGGSYTVLSTTGTQSWSGNGNNGTYLINVLGNPALDVHWGMEKTYDFYFNVFGRNSFDGNGSTIKQYINPSPSVVQIVFGSTGLPNNAFAAPAPYNFMVYGMGDGQTMNPLVTLDVEGHEFSHMVIGNNGNGGLIYQNESGALNESFADIFGTCIEFYANANANWTIGENIVISSPYYFRSLSNPNIGLTPQPDTYLGTNWHSTSNSSDNGGVHTNSGVQNFWFYLLCQGGTGTNDLGNSYSVTGIGITQARQLAYKNLTTYLGPNATYLDAYNGSLLAAQSLFGNPSTQYTAVKQAWYAVGIGNDPGNYCSGITNITATSGTITDGSGTANYNNNSNCKWIIAPPGATQISLNFTNFDTEANYDTVFVYNGPGDTYPLLATWWGNTLPPAIITTAGNGAMCIKFKSDITQTAGGWSANYTSVGITPSCSGGTVLATPTGSFNDGSGSSNYGNNQNCYWFIAPPCATSVTLSFSQFNTELNYDGVIIYDDLAGTNQLAVYTGTSIPSSVTSNTGKMLVVFLSDYSTTMQGFTANYTSTGSTYCSGVSTLNTSDNGTITDGSGSNNYCNNLDCKWLIQPPQATSITLNFTAFDVEPPSSDGQSIYDAVEVYDGTTTSSPLLGRYAGNNLPPAISSTGGSMLLRFYSDLEVSKQGWSANYTSTQNSYCNNTVNLTAANGTITDGSGTNQYSNNSNCSWLIEPANATSITLSFTSFETELNNDGVIVYNGANNTSPVLGQYSGSTIPPSLSSTGGSMYIEFLSGPSVRANGWSANYSSTTVSVIENELNKEKLKVFPNPTNGKFTILSAFDKSVTCQIMDIIGQHIYKTFSISKGNNQIDASELNKGVYLIKFRYEDGYLVERLIIN